MPKSHKPNCVCFYCRKNQSYARAMALKSLPQGVTKRDLSYKPPMGTLSTRMTMEDVRELLG